MRYVSATLMILCALMIGSAFAVAQSTAVPKSCKIQPNVNDDVSEALQRCFRDLPAQGTVALKPGKYILRHPILIDKPMTLLAENLSPGDTPCHSSDDSRCPVFLLTVADASPPTRPITIVGNNVSLDHLIVDGQKSQNPVVAFCQGDKRRMGSGVGVRAAKFSMTNSVLRHMNCDSALVVSAGSKGFRFTRNTVEGNGTHTTYQMWSDGLTVLDASDADIQNNSFYDNTDVQMILGGCRRCIIRANKFGHSSNKAGASFADLLVQGWPNTSGDFTDTNVSLNLIDCGPQKNCNIGLGIGADAWYSGKTFGVTVIWNKISNAEVGLNVDNVSGSVDVKDNEVSNSGGSFQWSCGVKTAAAVNVAPASLHFLVVGDLVGTPNGKPSQVEFKNCLHFRPPEKAAAIQD